MCAGIINQTSKRKMVKSCKIAFQVLSSNRLWWQGERTEMIELMIFRRRTIDKEVHNDRR